MGKRLLPRSLRARLAIGLSVSLTLLWIGASLFAAHVFRH